MPYPLRVTGKNFLSMTEDSTHFGMNGIPVFRLVLVGDEGAGKTAFLKKHLTGESDEKYKGTWFLEIYQFEFDINLGALAFEVWDCTGQDAQQGFQDGFHADGQCAIVMFDMTSQITYASNWHRDLIAKLDDLPIVLCASETDGEDRRLNAKAVNCLSEKVLHDYDISLIDMYTFDQPLLTLGRKLVGNPALEFVGYPADPQKPIITVDEELLKTLRKDLAKAMEDAAPSNAPDPLPPPVARWDQDLLKMLKRDLATVLEGEEEHSQCGHALPPLDETTSARIANVHPESTRQELYLPAQEKFVSIRTHIQSVRHQVADIVAAAAVPRQMVAAQEKLIVSQKERIEELENRLRLRDLSFADES